jgi:hypothetical protein
MTAHCYGEALRIALLPRAQWKTQIDGLPESCPKTDCTPAIGCRKRIADYLRVQYQCAQRRGRAQ